MNRIVLFRFVVFLCLTPVTHGICDELYDTLNLFTSLVADKSGLRTAEKQNIYQADGLQELPLQNAELDRNTFHVFSHGRPGELLLEGRWLDATGIAVFLRERSAVSQYSHLNIYGCEFAKGEEGRKAVADLQRFLGLSISASSDITGRNGNWVLEEGMPTVVKGMDAYAYSLQCTTCSGTVGGTGINDDFDGDGVCNLNDTDDDNDGIPDSVECPLVPPSEFKPTNWTAVTSGANINDIDPSDIFKATNALTVDGQNYDAYFQLISENRLIGTGAAILTKLVSGRLEVSNLFPNARDYVVYEIFFVKNGDPITSVVSFQDVKVNIHDLDNGAVGAGVAPNYTDIGAFVTSVTAPYTAITVGSNLQSYTYGTLTGYGLPTSLQGADNNASLTGLPASNTISASFSQKGKYRMAFGIRGTRTTALNDRGSVISFQVSSQIQCDTDNDGHPDRMDLDSDNDGIPDSYESGCTPITTPLTNCHLNADPSVVDGNGCRTGAATAICSTPLDTDSDGVPDYLDTDSDGDGCSDALEAGTNVFTVNNNTSNTYSAPSASANGLTNAGCITPANTNWKNASIHSACPPPVANDNSSSGNPVGSNVTQNILANDVLSDGTTQATTTNSTVTLTTTGLPAGSTLAGNVVTIPGEGTWTYDPINGNLTFDPETGFINDPTPLNYILTEIANGRTDNAIVLVGYDNAMPVKLTTFKVFDSVEGAKLTWNTSEESNFDRFEIQKAGDDGKQFTMIGTVHGGLGQYSFTDISRTPGLGYYRLKMIDVDGSFDFSGIVALQRGLNLAVYPNPAKGRTVQIDAEHIDSYRILDISGREVKAVMLRTGNSYLFTVADHTKPGLYFIEYRIGNQKRQAKFILIE